jgi:threonine/homoserine/homoserine lactone efflux protein
VGRVVADLLPLALVVAISPVPIVAVILMLLAPQVGVGAGFLAGWLTGIAGVTTASLLLTGASDPGSSSRSSAVASWAELVLGVLLLLLATRQWRSRPRLGEEPGVPAWLTALDRISATRAGGLGLVLSAANPKVLLVCLTAGVIIAGGDLSGAQATWSVVIFTVTAASSIAVPVLADGMGRKRMTGPLESLRGRLTAHSAPVTATLLLAIGIVLIGQGLREFV